MSILKSLIAIMVLVCAASTATVTFEKDTTIFANPERGWFVFYELKPVYPTNSNKWATDALLDNYFSQGYRLAKHVTLIPTNTAPIPQWFLDSLTRETARFRAHGMKIFYRFCYCWNLNINPDDAPLDVTLGHLDQLKPFFTANADVIWAHEMGFIGRWGEMHTSTNGHINPMTVGLSASGKQIVQKMLSVVPADRFVSLRYPQTIQRSSASYGSLGYTTPLTEATAYGGSEQSRLGTWYANFGAGDVLYHESADLQKWAPETRFLPMWAHCDHFQDVTMESQQWMDDANMFHYCALSNPKDESATADIYQRWVADGLANTFARNLGYRYRLASATLPSVLKPGTQFDLSLTMVNDGWARIMNPRTVEIILRAQSGGARYILTVDNGKGNRLWLPGAAETKTLTVAGGIPASIPVGNYDVIINLPDPYPSLRERPEYSIRLASQNMWEGATGYNKLNQTLQISASAGGTAYAGTGWFVLKGGATPAVLPRQNRMGGVGGRQTGNAVNRFGIDGRKLLVHAPASSRSVGLTISENPGSGCRTVVIMER